jgi:microtubule-associated protein-like 6
VYNAASLAVVYSKSTLKQQFLLGAHSDEVISISNHPAGQIFATGEVGKNPSIIVWDSKDIQVLCKLEGAHLNGVSFLAFNSKGNILASIGLDETSSLCIHDWMKGIKILTTPTEKGKIFCLCFLAMDLVPGLIGSSSGDTNSVINDVTKEVVVTGGVMHLKFWWWQGQNVLSQRALWGRWGREGRKETIICVASAHPSICITGSLSGNIMIWKDFKVFEYYS